MNVTKQDIKLGSCNFCTSTLNDEGTGFSYSYETVYEFTRNEGSGLSARICKKCLDELKYKADRIKVVKK